MYLRAYFITWSCYGTRLHGDERGTVDRVHNSYGTPRVPGSHSRHAKNAEQMAESALVLSSDMQRVVCQTIKDHTSFRGWELLAINVRTTHVHVVVSAALEPEGVMGQYKAWATRRMREAGLLPGRTRVWTPHGSTKYLWEIDDTWDAVHYVRNLQ